MTHTLEQAESKYLELSERLIAKGFAKVSVAEDDRWKSNHTELFKFGIKVGEDFRLLITTEQTNTEFRYLVHDKTNNKFHTLETFEELTTLLERR